MARPTHESMMTSLWLIHTRIRLQLSQIKHKSTRLYHAQKSAAVTGTRLPEDPWWDNHAQSALHTRKIDLAAKGGATSPQNPHCENPHFANRNTKGDKLNKAFPKTANAKRIYRSNKQRGPAAERGGSIELERRCAGRGVGIARTAAARRDRGRRKETKLVKENTED